MAWSITWKVGKYHDSFGKGTIGVYIVFINVLHSLVLVTFQGWKHPQLEAP